MKSLDLRVPTILQPNDFRMMVNSHGHIDPAMLHEINHGNYTEAETLYALATLNLDGFESNVVVVMQIVYSTLGPFPSCQISGRFTLPSGQQKTISVNAPARTFYSSNSAGHSAVDIRAENEGLYAAISKQFSPNGGPCLITYRLQYVPEQVDCIVQLESGPNGYALNGGKTYYYGAHRSAPGFVSTQPPLVATAGHMSKCDGYILEHFLPILTFHGHIQIGQEAVVVPKGPLAGGLFTHAIQAIKPHLAASRWNVYLMHDPRSNTLLHMVRWKTPAHYGFVEIYQGALMIDGDLRAICGGCDNSVVDVMPVLDPVSGYAIPRGLAHHWRAVDGHNFVAESHVQLQNLLGRHDVLDRLPHWLRLIIRRFITNPFIYQWLENGTACITLDGQSWCINGPVLIECVYLS
jgi:hypothetical protein